MLQILQFAQQLCETSDEKSEQQHIRDIIMFIQKRISQQKFPLKSKKDKIENFWETLETINDIIDIGETEDDLLTKQIHGLGHLFRIYDMSTHLSNKQKYNYERTLLRWRDLNFEVNNMLHSINIELCNFVLQRGRKCRKRTKTQYCTIHAPRIFTITTFLTDYLIIDVVKLILQY